MASMGVQLLCIDPIGLVPGDAHPPVRVTGWRGRTSVLVQRFNQKSTRSSRRCCKVLSGQVVAPTSTSKVEEAVIALKHGRPVCILDSATREGETDLFFPAVSTTPECLRQLRIQAGGELYISVGHEIAAAFGLPYAGTAWFEAAAHYPVLAGMSKYSGEMCQGVCSVGVSLDHRSTKTGAPDMERSLTCRRIAQLYDEVAQEGLSVAEAGVRLGAEFHVPGHIFLCMENGQGLTARQGHTELSIALARSAGLIPAMVGCVMLCNDDGPDFGALPPARAAEWAQANGVPFLTGPEVLEALGGAAPKGPAATVV